MLLLHCVIDDIVNTFLRVVFLVQLFNGTIFQNISYCLPYRLHGCLQDAYRVNNMYICSYILVS